MVERRRGSRQAPVDRDCSTTVLTEPDEKPDVCPSAWGEMLGRDLEEHVMETLGPASTL